MKFGIVKKIILGILIVNTVNTQEKTDSINIADIPLVIATQFLFHVALGLAHQVGPIIASKIFIAYGAEFSSPNETTHADVTFKSLILDGNYPEFKNEILNALMYGSAPLTGFLGCILALKGSNILNEFRESHNIKRAISKGWNKSLINDDQSSELKACVLMHAALNAFDYMPRWYKMTDEKWGGNTGAKMSYALEKHFLNKKVTK